MFHDFYDQDLDSDVESVDEMPTPRKPAAAASPKLTQTERMDMLRRVARMNKEVRQCPPLVCICRWFSR